MTRRLLIAIVAALTWGATAILIIPLPWVLLGAGLIGIASTYGAEPPTRRSNDRVLGRGRPLRQVG